MVADLYWRCSLAVVQMPLASLRSLASHHPDLTPHLAPEGAGREVEERIPLVRAVLPRFSMACTTREEKETAERLRAEAKVSNAPHMSQS